MYKDNQKGIAQLFLVASFAFAVLALSGVVFYKTVRSGDDVQGYAVSQLLPKASPPAAGMPCTKEMMVCSATPKKCCTGYILRGCTTFDGVAKDRPFDAAKGTVCVKSAGGAIIKQLPGIGNTKSCSRTSRCTVTAQLECCAGFEASTDGCTTTTVKRCLPKDTDKDGTPDLWDDDADGDGVLKVDDTDDDGDGTPDVDATTGKTKGFPEDPRLKGPIKITLPEGQKFAPRGPVTTPDPVLE